MKSRFLAAFAALSASLAAAPAASAGVYADDLAKCLVKSASDADKLDLMRWTFAAISLHPDLKTYSNFTDEQRSQITAKAGALMQRLMTVDCRAETIAALKFEGPSAVGPAFNMLGQVGARGLMTDPAVTKGLAELVTGFDMKQLMMLVLEAQPDANPRN